MPSGGKLCGASDTAELRLCGAYDTEESDLALLLTPGSQDSLLLLTLWSCFTASFKHQIFLAALGYLFNQKNVQM